MGVTRVANVTGLDTLGIPVVAVYRPNARSLVVSQGKGLDLWAAKASGLMEAIEGFHAEHAELPLRLLSARELARSHELVDLAGLPRVSIGSFHLDRQILWCEARALGSDRPIWVPYELVHTNFTLPLPAGSGYFTMSSNGLASGNHLLEAISHGLCEVIERDALALWDAAGGSSAARGRIALESIDDRSCEHVLAAMRDAELAIGIWDITSDIGIAAFACVLVDRGPNHVGQVYTSHGSGCHPSRSIALLRALTEAAQTRLTFIAGTRDDADREFFERARDPARIERLRAQLDAPGEGRGFHAVPTREADDFEDDVRWQRERLAAVGLDQIAIVDLTQPRFGIPVVRVIVPGLESLHGIPGYVPGARARRARQQAGGEPAGELADEPAGETA
jgi:ribosomal protein S12 methylthiotransferase accessory factor